jgi:hypothetical protein
MNVSDLIGVLSKFDPDLDLTVAGVDFVVIHERTGGWTGHTPNTHQKWIEINPPETVEPVATEILERMRDRFRETSE